MISLFTYSQKYSDQFYEYRHVKIPKEKVPLLPKNKLLGESDFTAIGLRISHVLNSDDCRMI